MAESTTRLLGLLTCLGITGVDRPTLHEVFHALAYVPSSVLVYVEAQYSQDLSFAVRLVDRAGDVLAQSEGNLVLTSRSGRLVEIVEITPLAQALPGAYNVEVVDLDEDSVLGRRPIFFGEM